MGPFEKQVDTQFMQTVRENGLRKELQTESLSVTEAVGSFKLGRVVATPGALRAMEDAGVAASQFLRRHAKGDWGELSRADARLNDDAVRNDGRILSSYSLPDGEKIWIITEWDRSATTLLLPSEY